MRTGVLLAIALLALPAPLLAADGRVELGAGAGYETNVNNAVSTARAEGSPWLGADAYADGWLPLGRDVELLGALSLTYTGVIDASDLSVGSLRGGPGLRWWLADGAWLEVHGRLGGSWYGDADRNGFDVGAGATLRYRLTPRLVTRLGYDFRHREAQDRVFDDDRHRLRLAASLGLLEDLDLSLAYAFEVGSENYYTTAPATASPTGAIDGRAAGDGEGPGMSPGDGGLGDGGDGPGDGEGPGSGDGPGDDGSGGGGDDPGDSAGPGEPGPPDGGGGPMRPDDAPTSPSDSFGPDQIVFRVDDTLGHAGTVALTGHWLAPVSIRLAYTIAALDGDAGTSLDHLFGASATMGF